MLLVDCLGSRPIMTPLGSIERNASITTLPLTDWIGSITTATARGLSCSKDCKTRNKGRQRKKTQSSICWLCAYLLGVYVDG
jgi:hypothetical protein